MSKFSYPYEVNGKSVTGNGSLIPICSLSNCSLLPSLTVLKKMKKKSVGNDFTPFFLKATCIKLFSIHLKNDVGFCWISKSNFTSSEAIEFLSQVNRKCVQNK